uniref:Putative secreted peptide n=1 Tax=Anopheles braziliensis TaxID=58242 RepID=A0A2M3ZQ42_9DIPT
MVCSVLLGSALRCSALLVLCSLSGGRRKARAHEIHTIRLTYAHTHSHTPLSCSFPRTRSLARSIARSLTRPFVRPFVRSFSRSLTLAHWLAGLARWLRSELVSLSLSLFRSLAPFLSLVPERGPTSFFSVT